MGKRAGRVRREERDRDVTSEGARAPWRAEAVEGAGEVPKARSEDGLRYKGVE